MTDSKLQATSGLSEEAELLRQFLRWANVAVLFLGAVLGVLYAIFRSPMSLALALLAFLVIFPGLHYTRSQVLRNRTQLAVFFIASGLWTMSLVLSLIGFRVFAASAMVAVLSVVIALPYSTPKVLRRIMVGAALVCTLCALLAVFGPVVISTLPADTSQMVVVTFVPILLGLCLISLWHSSSRLRRSADEMRRAILRLAESEHTLERKVEARTAELGLKNEALEASQREVGVARDAALEASLAKSKFLASMSHELRTPLNAIIGYSEILQEEARDDGNESYVPDLDKILGSGRYLLTLINGVLDLSKIEAGKMEVYLEDCDVAEVVRGVEGTVKPLVQKNTNTLVVGPLEGLGSMRSDVTKLRQMLFNLLSNASKFTRNGTIRLDVARENGRGGDWLCFRVKDSGIGMNAEQLGKVFEEFGQAEPSTTKEFGGTGLGMPITKKFCEMLGGRIDVTSAPGAGSCFEIHLPALAPRPAEEPVAELAAAAAPSGTPIQDGTTVLVIDDDPAALDLIARFLKGEGYQVITASGGEEGLRLARAHSPDLITLDVLMPQMDGWAVLGQLKAEPALAHIPVILVTMTDDRNMGYTLGASEFLTKPIDRDQLSEVLRKYVPSGNARATALIVDDEPAAREMMRRGVEGAGWKVVEAENGRVALERVAEAVPDLILLDLMMPEMDGFECVSRLRKNDAWRGIPVLIVTAKDLTAEERTRLEGSVVRILEKSSYTQQKLLDEVRSLVGTLARPETSA